jgi:hypothetical protein
MRTLSTVDTRDSDRTFHPDHRQGQGNGIRIRVGGTVEVDVAGWDAEYGTGHNANAVASDVRAHLALDNLIPEHLSGIVRKAEKP